MENKKIIKKNKTITSHKPKHLKKPFSDIFKTKKPSLTPPILETLFVIIDKERGDYVSQLLTNLKVELKVISRGKGTANSNMANILGLGNLEKEIIIAVIKLKDSDKILETLNKKLLLEEKHYGIAFTIPIKSATSDMLEEVGYYF